MGLFSPASLAKLATCHPKLQRLATEAIKVLDMTVLFGERGKEEQDHAFAIGTSKLSWPNSKHNRRPSEAIDLAPYPIKWDDRERFAYQAGVILGIAHMLGLGIRWGGNWDGDDRICEKGEDDLVHFELLP